MLKVNNIIRNIKRFNGISVVVDDRIHKRESIITDWTPKDSSRKIIVQIADKEDLELVARKRCEGFVGTNSLFTKLGRSVQSFIHD